MALEIIRTVNEDTNADDFEVWDNDELIYTGYFDAETNISDEAKYLIILAHAFKLSAEDVLNLDELNK